MCRLYAFRATERTKIECTLVHAQNALIVQSYRDHSGTSHLNGWGLALYQDGRLEIMRQAKAAVDNSNFRRVRRPRLFPDRSGARAAGDGRPSGSENTHPFQHGRWAFVHNGTLARFAEVRSKMLAMMTPQHRAAIQGETDSEHIFHLLLSAHELAPAQPLCEILRRCLAQIAAWCREIDSAARIGLNILLTDGERLVGSRWGRTLHYVERVGIHDCEVCGFPHVRHDPRHSYRAIVIASEPISHEHWREIPERAVFAVSPEMALQIDPLPSAAEAGQAIPA